MSENNKEALKKKLLHRSNYRGCKETDLLMGKFANMYLEKLTDHQLEEYDYLLNQADHDIYQGITNPNAAVDELKNLSIWSLVIQANN